MARSPLTLAAALAFTLAAPAWAEVQRTSTLRPPAARTAPADLASAVAGTYRGDVISDARGSSKSGVRVTVKRVGPNLVEVSADYRRLPTVRIRLTQALNAIVQAGDDHVFLIDRDKDPRELSLTIDDASLSLRRD
jgi:hypothetical protein